MPLPLEIVHSYNSRCVAGLGRSVIASFVFNRIWTFELEGRVDWMREGVPFLLFSLLGWGLQAVAIVMAERRFGNGVVVLNTAKIAGVGAIWLLKFFVYRNIVFVDRRPRDDEEDVGLIEAEASYPGVRPPRAASR